jgi:RNA polymerase sigma factor for flagellar operon FliA
VRDRIRAAISSLPPRERKVIGMYYYAEATMKQIGAAIGVNESRVSQLHARAVQRLRKALGAECSAAEAVSVLKPAILSFEQTMIRMKTARLSAKVNTDGQPGVVLAYKMPIKPAAKRRAPLPERERIAAAR